MASIKISELTPVSSASGDDVLIVNDSSNNTRKITFDNLFQAYVPLVGDSDITGDIDITGGLVASSYVRLANNVIRLDSVALAVKVNYSESPTYNVEIGDGTGVRLHGAQPLMFADTDSSNFISLQPPGTLVGDTPYTLPGEYPSSDGYVLASSTTGGLSWVANGGGAGTPGGLDGYVQYNESGTFTASANFTFDALNDILSAPNFRGDIENADGNITIKGGTGVGSLTLNKADNSSGIQILHPGVTGTGYGLTLPIDAGTDGYVLETDGTGVTSWAPVSAASGAPTGSGDDGIAGEIRYDTDYFYVCIGTNSWKRVALTSF